MAKSKKTSTKSKRKKVTRLTENQKKKILPVLIKILRTAKSKRKAVNHYWIKSYLQHKLGITVPVRITSHLIHHIRVNGVIKKLIGGNEGFYIASNNSDGEAYLRRISGYIKEMTQVRNALKGQFKL
jgi:hypothetical protein